MQLASCHGILQAMARNARSRNFHVPLPDDLYLRLRGEAKRSGRPATDLARQAIQTMLRRREKLALHEALATYAARQAGGPADLDPALERAAVDELLDDEDT